MQAHVKYTATSGTKLLSAVDERMASRIFEVPMVLTGPDSRRVQVKSGHLNVSGGTQNGKDMCTTEENQSIKCTESRFSFVCGFVNFFLNV